MWDKTATLYYGCYHHLPIRNSWVHPWFLFWCVVFCTSLFVHFSYSNLTIVLFIHRLLITPLISLHFTYSVSSYSTSATTIYPSAAYEFTPHFQLSFCISNYNFMCSVFHCIIYSSIYGFWLPLWYLQTLLIQFQAIRTTDGRF